MMTEQTKPQQDAAETVTATDAAPETTETKGPEHCVRVLQRLRDAGFRLAEH